MATEKFDLKKALIIGVAILFLIPLLWLIRQKSQADLRQGMEKQAKIEALEAKKRADQLAESKAAEAAKIKRRVDLLNTPDLTCYVQVKMVYDEKRYSLMPHVYANVRSRSQDINYDYESYGVNPVSVAQSDAYEDLMGRDWVTLKKYAEQCIEKVRRGESPSELIRQQPLGG